MPEDRIEQLKQKARDDALLKEADLIRSSLASRNYAEEIMAATGVPPIGMDEDGTPVTFDPTIDKVVRVDPDLPVEPEPEVVTPYEFVSQAKLFKSGVMGMHAVLYSSYEGGYDPAPVTYSTQDDPVVFTATDDNVIDQIGFAAGYCYGWVEHAGGDATSLKIWLEPYEDAGQDGCAN